MFKRTSRSSRNLGGAKGSWEFATESEGGRARPLAVESISGRSRFSHLANVFKAALAGTALALIAPSAALADSSNTAPVYATNVQCIGSTNPGGALGSCTANDLSIALVNNSSVTCTAGVDPVATLQLNAQLQSSSNVRHNVGIYIALDGLDPSTPSSSGGSASCDAFSTPITSPFSVDAGNTCGNVTSTQGTYALPHTVDVPCTPGSSGSVTLNAVAVWAQNTATCTNASQLVLGAPSKCKAGAFVIPVFGSLIIKKVASGGGATSFPFTGSPNPANFSLADAGQQVIQTATALSTTAQVLSAQETLGSLPAGWTLGSISCVDINGANASSFVTVNQATGQVSASLTGTHPSATCTYTNVQSATLTLQKTVSNTHGGTATSANFTPSIDGTATAWGTAVVVAAGSHTASETGLAGYTAGSWGGACAANGSVTLTPGQNATCTITNSDQAPTLTLVKTVSNTHGGTATSANFTPSIDGTATTWGTAVAVNAGSHSASETSLTGYAAGSWGGACAANGAVTLALGQNATCTITNSDQPTTLTLVKTVSNTHGGTATSANFTPSVDGTATTWGTAIAVNAGAHTATETSLAGYTAGSWGGACAANGTVTLVQGQNATCTITNSDQAAHLTLVKTVSNTHGGTATSASFTPSIDGTATTWGTAVAVNAGSHTATETSLTGYTAGSWGGDCAANGTLTLTPGQNATCTITNSDQPTTLTLVKTVSNTNGGTATASSFTPSIDGTATAWGTAVAVNAGSHTASETSLAGYTAGAWGGACAANGTMTLVQGQNATCTITNSDQSATLTLVKTVSNTHGGNATSVNFTPSIDGTATTWGTAVTLGAGAHTATETSLAGYTAGAWGGDCAANGTVTLTPGQNATCTITNSDQVATLTLVKTVSNTHGGTATASSFTPSIDGTAATWGTAVGVSAGLHTASETSLAGYTAGSWGGACAADGTVTLTAGQNATCTITNSDQAATLTLVKTVSNTHGGTATASSFTPSVDGTATTWGTAMSLSAGSHTATETALAGYTAGSWGGACAANGTVTLTVGQNATCTITNSDQAATLTLVKTVSNTHGGTATAANFTPSVDGTATSWGTAVTLGAGVHTATETSLTGYTASSWGGACAANGAVTLTVGQNATCTITNSDQPTTLTLVKTVSNMNGGTATASSFTPSIDGTATTWVTAVAVNAGAHTVSETGLTGYTAGPWGGACAVGGTVTLVQGQNATCTITNSDQAAPPPPQRSAVPAPLSNVGLLLFAGLGLLLTGVYFQRRARR